MPILNYLINMTHKEFYIWLEGYLTSKLENKNVEITPIIEKMGEVMSDEQKWVNDFESYRKIKQPFESITIQNSPE
jgi:hypothetical protein